MTLRRISLCAVLFAGIAASCISLGVSMHRLDRIEAQVFHGPILGLRGRF